MQDDKLTIDEARRAEQHESIKSKVEDDVGQEIAARATAPTVGEERQVDAVAGQLRGKAIKETMTSEREVERGRRAARGSQFIDYAFYVLYSLLAIRFVLALIGANASNGFVQFINSVSGPFYAPFQGIVSSPSAAGITLALPVFIAIVVYLLLHMGINGVLRMVAHRKTEI
jgi:uncharacterized protein YggT (Ycf19 family)